MKKLLISVCLLLASLCVLANKVDDIKTDSDVVKFIQPLQEYFNYKGAPRLIIYSNEALAKKLSADSIMRTWHIQNWQKTDFNNDRKTDLLAIINWYYYDHSYVAIDKGDNTFQLIQIGGGGENDYQLASIAKYHKEQVILLHGVYNVHPYRKNLVKTSRTDTLVYKYGNFVEYNKNPARYKIDSISFGTQWGWYGSENTPPKYQHPDRTIVIDHSGNTVLINNKDFVYYVLNKGQQKPHNPKTTAGTFNTVISQAQLEDIYGLIDYLSIKKLNERYTVHVTDLDSNFLRIKFADGSVKYIADYGGSGTFGLKNLFSKFYALPGSENWK